MLGKTWKKMSSESKQEYIEEAKRLRKRHMEENPDYKYKPKRKNKSLKGVKNFDQNMTMMQERWEIPWKREQWEQINSKYSHNTQLYTNSNHWLNSIRHTSGSEGVSSASTSPEIGSSQMLDYQLNQQMQYDVQSVQFPHTFSHHPNHSGFFAGAENIQSSKNNSPVNSLTQPQCSEGTYQQQMNSLQPSDGAQTSNHQPNYSVSSSLPSYANLNQENGFIPNPSFGNPYEHQQHMQNTHHTRVVQTSCSRQPAYYGHYDQASVSPACQGQAAQIHPAQPDGYHGYSNFTSNSDFTPDSNPQY